MNRQLLHIARIREMHLLAILPNRGSETLVRQN